MARTAAPLEQRFWQKVDRRAVGGCWPWIGYRNAKGYGRIVVDGRSVAASRVAWSLTNGVEFPRDKFACHACDNPPCCNPAHIWPGTALQNVQDACRKGRYGARPATVVAGAMYCRNGHLRTADNAAILGGHLRCLICMRAQKLSKRPFAGPNRFGHDKLCRQCGHHRTDDLSSGGVWRCRPCNRRRDALAKRTARLLSKQTGKAA